MWGALLHELLFFRYGRSRTSNAVIISKNNRCTVRYWYLNNGGSGRQEGKPRPQSPTAAGDLVAAYAWAVIPLVIPACSPRAFHLIHARLPTSTFAQRTSPYGASIYVPWLAGQVFLEVLPQ